MAQVTKFSDRKKKSIVKDYVECQNASAVARKHGCSEATVRRIVGKNPDVTKRVEEKKEENTRSILEHMQRQAGDICEVMDKLVEAMKSEEVIDRANLQQLATTLGIIIDKYSAQTEREENESGGIVILPEAKEGGKDNG